MATIIAILIMVVVFVVYVAVQKNSAENRRARQIIEARSGAGAFWNNAPANLRNAILTSAGIMSEPTRNQLIVSPWSALTLSLQETLAINILSAETHVWREVNSQRLPPEKGAAPETVKAPDAPLSAESKSLIGPSSNADDNVGYTGTTPNSPQIQRRFGFDSYVLCVIALLSFVLGAIQGFIPVFLILSVLFGSLALLCFLKYRSMEPLRAFVLAASVLLAGVLGVALDQNTFGVHYRYFSQGSAQYRVDERAGRTDRLEANRWVTVAYDKPAQPIPMMGPFPPITLNSGDWSSGPFNNLSNNKICFTAENSSNYVIDRIVVSVGLKNNSHLPQDVTLKSDMGLIEPGDTESVCGKGSPEILSQISATNSWVYSFGMAYGWRR